MSLYKKILAISIILIAFVSCKKDFLNRSPQSVISDADYWKSTNDLKLYCNGFYSYFPAYTGFGTIGIYGVDADRGSDNMITTTPNGWLNGQTTVSSGPGWSWSYLRNVNYLMAHYNTVQDSWDNIKPYVGEALFFRAYFYFDMLRTFGDLPWVNKPLSPSDSAGLYATRISRSIIVDSMLADLENAASYLPSKTAASAGRVYKEYALAFASRVALYEGTWEKYHKSDAFGVTGSDGSKYIQKAVDAAQSVISSGIFSLDNTETGSSTGYWSLFNQIDYSGSKEVMFWRQYSLSLGIVHNWARYTAGSAGRGLTKSLIDDYLCTDGKPISTSPLYTGDDSLTTVVRNRDPRLNQTIYVNDSAHIVTNNQPNGTPNVIFTTPTFSAANESKPATGYDVYKGHTPDYNQQYAAEVGVTGLILFRYAEVLLNFAEAKAELGTLTQTDVDNSIKLLRSRVGMPNLNIANITNDTKWLFPTLSPVINEVRRERRVELAAEGFRTDDILRWAAAGQLIRGWQPRGAKKSQWTNVVPASVLDTYPVDANGYIQFFKNVSSMSAGYQFNVDRDYLQPIPLSEIQKPGNKITQNPGW